MHHVSEITINECSLRKLKLALMKAVCMLTLQHACKNEASQLHWTGSAHCSHLSCWKLVWLFKKSKEELLSEWHCVVSTIFFSCFLLLLCLTMTHCNTCCNKVFHYIQLKTESLKITWIFGLEFATLLYTRWSLSLSLMTGYFCQQTDPSGEEQFSTISGEKRD